MADDVTKLPARVERGEFASWLECRPTCVTDATWFAVCELANNNPHVAAFLREYELTEGDDEELLCRLIVKLAGENTRVTKLYTDSLKPKTFGRNRYGKR